MQNMILILCFAICLLVGCDVTDTPQTDQQIETADRFIQSFDEPCNYRIVNIDDDNRFSRVTPRAYLAYKNASSREEVILLPMVRSQDDTSAVIDGSTMSRLEASSVLEGSKLEVQIYLHSEILNDTTLTENPSRITPELVSTTRVMNPLERLVAYATTPPFQPNELTYRFEGRDFVDLDCSYWADEIHRLCIEGAPDTWETVCHRQEQ